MRDALDAIEAEQIAVPAFQPDFLARGHAVHFRCRRQDVSGLRIDLMSKLRGVPSFEELWSRRTVIEVEELEIDLLSIPDPATAKKTQRDKHWPMIRRLRERIYFDLPSNPRGDQIEFLLLELRTPELLEEQVGKFPEHADRAASTRAVIQRAQTGQLAEIAAALVREEEAERDRDRIYWKPLKQELEQLRRTRVSRANCCAKKRLQ